MTSKSNGHKSRHSSGGQGSHGHKSQGHQSSGHHPHHDVFEGFPYGYPLLGDRSRGSDLGEAGFFWLYTGGGHRSHGGSGHRSHSSGHRSHHSHSSGHHSGGGCCRDE